MQRLKIKIFHYTYYIINIRFFIICMGMYNLFPDWIISYSKFFCSSFIHYNCSCIRTIFL